jgi:UDP-2,3-diacylglucosamine hydrolase
MATLGLVAGTGNLPAELAASARRAGWRVVAVGLHGLTDPALAAHVEALEWAHVADFGRLFDVLRTAGAADVVLAGKVPKTFLWEHPDLVRPDARALAAFAALRDRQDDSLLGAVVHVIETEGLRVRSQLELAPDLCAPAGVLGTVRPSAEQEQDIAFGWPIAKALGALDVGQSVVVQGKAVLALEAVEGTDRAIERGASLAERGRGVVVVKVAKPKQDLRFDVPTIGLATLRTLAKGGGGALAVEAGLTLVLEREALVAEADAAGIALLGVDGRLLASAEGRA